MEDQKAENVLNLALGISQNQLEKSEFLSTGYDFTSDSWELIIKYNGEINKAVQELFHNEVKIEYLIANYAIVTISKKDIAAFLKLKEVEYVEKPKKIFPQTEVSLGYACFYKVLLENGNEKHMAGDGVYIAVIDSGIDYTLPVFRFSDGRSKIAWLWDQTKKADAKKGEMPPEGFYEGVEYNQEQINQNLFQLEQEEKNPQGDNNTNIENSAIFSKLTTDVTGHGTNVASICTMASPGSRLIIVKLDTSLQSTYPATTSLMRAYTYVVRKTQNEKTPVSVNLSYGNTYGDHKGQSLLERFIDNVSEIGRCTFCVGSGNEADRAGHFHGILRQENEAAFAIGSYESSLSLQIWKNYEDTARIQIISPSGEVYEIKGSFYDREAGILDWDENGIENVRLQNTRLIIFCAKPGPYQPSEEIYIEFQPVNIYIDSGIWQIVFKPENVRNGNYDLYLPSYTVRSLATRFLNPEPTGTFTIPSTAVRVISVGAYNAYQDVYAPFSGRGERVESTSIAAKWQKPDLAAPGENIRVIGRHFTETVSGTSYAVPFVTGAAAILMSWGIIQGNDPYLYGQKVKAYLKKGAKKIRAFNEYPNEYTGWGALCLENSFPDSVSH